MRDVGASNSAPHGSLACEDHVAPPGLWAFFAFHQWLTPLAKLCRPYRGYFGPRVEAQRAPSASWRNLCINIHRGHPRNALSARTQRALARRQRASQGAVRNTIHITCTHWEQRACITNWRRKTVNLQQVDVKWFHDSQMPQVAGWQSVKAIRQRLWPTAGVTANIRSIVIHLWSK